MKPVSLRRLLLATALLIGFASALAGTDLSQPLPINPLLHTGKLANGLTYYIQKNSKPEKRVELRLVVKAGSILEDEDQQGLAHFTEHMAFNGSRHFKKHQLISYLQSIGIKFGADLNAYTSFDETVYILPIPTDKKQNLETGMLVLEDWAHGLSMNHADIDAERNIILEEARLGKGADDRMNKQLYPALFNGSRYAERLPIGKEDIISHFDYPAIERFYADWYRPDLMAVFVIGDIDPVQAEKMIRAHFGKLTNPQTERPRVYASVLTRSDTAAMVITDPEATSNMLMIRYPVQASVEEKTLADYRHSLIKNLTASMLNQRLQELTQQATPPFLGGASGIESLVRGYESFSSFGIIGRAGVEPAVTALVQENERARQFGFSADELARSKKNMLRLFESQYNERAKSDSAGYAAEYIRNFLTDESIPGIANEYAYASRFLPTISLVEVNQYARSTIPSDISKLVVYLGADKASETIPEKTQLLGWVEAAEKLPVSANTDSALPANLMAHPPTPGSIIAEIDNKLIGTTELTLSNGLHVTLKPTDFQDDQILIGANRFGGQSLFEQADRYNAQYASAIDATMGVDGFTPTEVQKILAGKSLSVQTSLDMYTDSVRGASSRADLETLFQTLYLRLLSPRKDPQLFDNFIKSQQDISRNSMSRPDAVFSDALLTTLYEQHPRLNLTPKPADFSQINLDRSIEIYRQRFSSAKGFNFVITGSFTAEQIKPLIATYLASLPTTEIATRYHDLQIRPVSGIVQQEVRSGSEPKSTVAVVFSGPAKYSKEENLRFNALIEVMNLRIIDQLREKLSLIYSGGMAGAFDRTPWEHYRIRASLPCDPKNTHKVSAALFAEVDKIQLSGATQEELDKVKQNWIKQQRIAMRTNALWMSSLENSLLYGTDPADILTVEKRINALTTDDIRQAAQRYLNTSNFVQVVLYPEKLN